MGDYKDDMGGIGSIQRVNRTLYVGRIHEEEDDLRRISNGGGANTPGGPSWRDGGRTVKGGKSVGQARREGGMANRGPFVMSNTEKVLRRHFGEWGTIERGEFASESRDPNRSIADLLTLRYIAPASWSSLSQSKCCTIVGAPL